MHFGVAVYQEPLGDVQRVAGRQRRDELLLLALVVQHRNLGALGRPKLLPVRRIADRNRERRLQDGGGGADNAHAPASELPQRGGKALGGAGHRGAVAPAAVHRRKAVEQVRARHADMREADGTVVHAIEADLVAAVPDLAARHDIACVITDLRDDGVNTMVVQPTAAVRLGNLEAGKHGSKLSVAGSVANPPLDGALVGRVDDPLVGGDVQDGLRLQAGHVAAVVELRHGEAAGRAERVDVVEELRAVALRAQVHHAAAPQRELHAHLDCQG
mmetsp:Transcript_10126/g.25928  ORF Transcript_10126/g.25928 Transcript_10126/m.25928 type:complete len:273 (+) Transcript_10126:94-912(+)